MSDDRESKLRDGLELDRWEMAKRCAATLEREDWGSESFEIAAFALWYAMSGGQRESLAQILFSGPVWDGDHISKSARDDLFKLGLATRVCHKGEQGFTAASYRAFTVFKASGQEKQRKLDKLRDDRRERDYDALKEFVADKTSASAIAALEAPAQPLDELRSVPGAEEEVRDQLWQLHELAQDEICAVPSKAIGEAVAAWGNAQFAPRDDFDPNINFVVEPWEGSAETHAADLAASWKSMYAFTNAGEPINWLENPPPVRVRSLPADTTVQPAELTVADLDAPEIPEGFTKWAGGVYGDFVKANPSLDYGVTEVEVLFRSGKTLEGHPAGFMWSTAEQLKANGWTDDMADGGKIDPADDIIAYRIIEAPAPEQDASVEIEPTTDLWQQGYNDKLNGFEPSLAEPEYTKGYEARALIEREHRETMERAKFFEGGMMADADRHAKHDGPFAWLRKKEPA